MFLSWGGGGEVTTTKEVKFKAHRLEGGGGIKKGMVFKLGRPT